MSEKADVAERLKAAMIERGHVALRGAPSGVDVAALSKAADVSYEMARRYADGMASPGRPNAKRIAKWLGINVAWLLHGEGPRYAGANQGEASADMSPEVAEIAEAAAKLSPQTRDLARVLIMFLATLSDAGIDPAKIGDAMPAIRDALSRSAQSYGKIKRRPSQRRH